MIKILTDKKHANLLRLWWAQVASQFGDRIHQLALLGLIAERSPGSATSLAKLMAFTILPVFFVQPFAAVLVDRWDRRTTLFVCDIARGSLVLSIPLLFISQASMIPIYIVVFLVFCFPRFYVPAKLAIIPDLVNKEHLTQANSLMTTTGMIAAGLGGALGAFLIEFFGAKNGFYIDAMTFFVSAILVFSIRGVSKMKSQVISSLQYTKNHLKEESKSVWLELKEGFQYLYEHKEIRSILSLLFAFAASAGAVYVVLIVFIQNAFNSITLDLGILVVGLVCGLFLGVILYGKFGQEASWYRTINFCLLACGGVMVLFANIVHLYPYIGVAIALAFLWGVTIAPIIVAGNTAIQLVADDQMRGKVFGALEIVNHFAFLMTMLWASWLSDYISQVWILTFVGIMLGFVGVVGLMNKGHKETKSQSHTAKL